MSKAPQHFVMGEELFELHTVHKETLLSSLFTGILLRGDGCCHEQNKRNFSSNSLLESMSFSSLRPRECTEVRRTPRGAFLPSHSSTANAQEKQRNSNLSRASTVSMTWLHRPAYLTLMQTVRLVRFLAVSA